MKTTNKLQETRHGIARVLVDGKNQERKAKCETEQERHEKDIASLERKERKMTFEQRQNMGRKADRSAR